MGHDLLEQPVLVRAAGGAVADDADLVTRAAVLLRQIPDMAENATHGRAKAVNDAQGLLVLHRFRTAVL
ncbi:hypothetical protein D3C86_2021260 [compost metagenome]